ncbi:MAG: ABC transporter ATP-binding protein [Phycisphaeraceae bacterium]|nr:ABC transporter ATP-binding protein [Phycisphaerae bacterium]MBX3392301.1 ABC transporter ATP-binding protein [Phycisphaeraceae bacterium]
MTIPILQVGRLHKTYRLGRVDVPVLRGASLTLGEGETLAVLGASGSGKSTLLHLIGGLDRPDLPIGASSVGRSARCGGCGQQSIITAAAACATCGRALVRGRGPADAGGVEFRGRPLSEMTAGELDRYRGRDVGFVFQFYHLLPELTVLQNVLLGAMTGRGPVGYLSSRGQSRRRAMELLDRVGLGRRLGHRPAELSGGERQRVAIARGLVNTPSLLLADEPTGNLDHITGGKILDLLDQIRRESRQSMVIVTHDRETAARADRIITLVDGRVEGPGAQS